MFFNYSPSYRNLEWGLLCSVLTFCAESPICLSFSKYMIKLFLIVISFNRCITLNLNWDIFITTFITVYNQIYSTSRKFVVFWLADGHWINSYIPWPGSLTSYFAWNCLSIEQNTYPTTSHGIWDLSHTSVSYIPLSFASWDIVTSVWDKSSYPMAGCWISYNVLWFASLLLTTVWCFYSCNPTSWVSWC